MSAYLITRQQSDVDELVLFGDHKDSRKACWRAIRAGSRVIGEIQSKAAYQGWLCLEDAIRHLDPRARRILEMRSEAIQVFKQAPHHEKGYRLSRATGAPYPREADALCLISGHAGLEIPAMLDATRVVLDVEHMEQALGPATLDEIAAVRLAVGEFVYISTNVSETPQLVRDLRTGAIDTRSSAALTASKVVAAIQAGADVVKVGFANIDPIKRDLRFEEVAGHMRLVRSLVDRVVKDKLVNMPLNRTTRYPLCAVFFPEIGIDAHGDKPLEIAQKGLKLAHEAGWQAVLIDTFEKHTGRRYFNFLSTKDTAELTKSAHRMGLEYWVAGSVRRNEIRVLLEAGVDLICFGGAARHREGVRSKVKDGAEDESIKPNLVRGLLAEFGKAGPLRQQYPQSRHFRPPLLA
jgi:uncharacterized protein (UPF0264 family)